MDEFSKAYPHSLNVIQLDNGRFHSAKSLTIPDNIVLLFQPPYSPDLNPIEGLWKWMREDVTQNYCHISLRQLFDACTAFIARINANPLQIISRLWPKFELDPEFEKLLVSI